MKWKTRSIVFMGLLVSLNIILTRGLGIMVGNTIRISFGSVPIMLAGILFGPMAGAVTGIAADLIGFALNPMGAYFIGFTISAGLVGFIPGLFFFKHKEDTFSLTKLIPAVTTVEFFVHLGLNTLWLIIMYNKGFAAIFPGRLITRFIMTPLEVLLISLILRALKTYKTTEK